MELRLLHHWMTVVSRPFLNTPAPKWGALWRQELPLIALKSDGVLYAMLTMSATHLLPTLTPASTDHDSVLSSRDQYLVSALEHQRTAVENIKPSNVDELSFAALLISLNAFSMLRERSLEPYEPPMTWLEMGRGAGSVMRQAAALIGQTSGTKLQQIIDTTAPIHKSFEAQELDREALKPYEPILNHDSDSDSVAEDSGTSEVYLQTLAVIAAFRTGLKSGEPPYVHLRRITMFPFTVPAKFIDLVRDREPRALVVLAHFFAVISTTEALQYLGNTGDDDTTTSKREILAIQQSLPQRWQQLMIWPVDEVNGDVRANA